MQNTLKVAIAPAIKTLEKGQKITFLKEHGVKYSTASSTITRIQNDTDMTFSMKKCPGGVIVTRTA